MQRKSRAGDSRWDQRPLSSRSSSASGGRPPRLRLGNFPRPDCSPAATTASREDHAAYQTREPTPPPRIPRTRPEVRAAASPPNQTGPKQSFLAAWSRPFQERSPAFVRAPRWMIVVLTSICLNLAIVTAIAIFTFPSRSRPRTITLSAVSSEPADPTETLQWELPSEVAPQTTIQHVPGLPTVSESTATPTRSTTIELTDPGAALTASPVSGELPTAAGLSQPVQPRGGAEFCGAPAAGQRFVFLVDSSRSMARGGLQLAKQQLLQAIRRLRSDQKFQVIFYDQELHYVTGSPTDLRPELLPATQHNQARLEEWMDRIRCQQGGSPESALKFAVDLAPDAVFLLSDGDFSDKVVQRVRRFNRIEDPVFGDHPLVVVHTISFARSLKSSGERVRRMQMLARENSGTHRFFIARPKSAQRR